MRKIKRRKIFSLPLVYSFFGWHGRWGFTLVEFLLAAGVMMIVLSVAWTLFSDIVLGSKKNKSSHEVSGNARFALMRIANRIRESDSVVLPLAGGTASSLTLSTSIAGANPTVFDLSEGAVRISEAGGPALPLTPNDVVVQELQFFNLSSAGMPGTVRVRMVVSAANSSGIPEYDFEETYFGSATIRRR
jgi:type II secretory pathway pseudopilin PulG